MEEETKEKRSLTHAVIMLGTFLICAGVVVLYFLTYYPNYDRDRDSQIFWALLTFPTLCLCKIATLLMALFCVLGMGFNPEGMGYFIFAVFFMLLCNGPYLLLFWYALKPKYKWLMYLFIAWSIANATGFLYTKGYFKSRDDHPKTSTEARSDGQVRDWRR
jgi:hypothetical protein